MILYVSYYDDIKKFMINSDSATVIFI